MAYTTRESLYPNRIARQELARLVAVGTLVTSESAADAVLDGADGIAIIDQAIADYAELEIEPLLEHFSSELDTDATLIAKLERVNAVGALYYLERRIGKNGEENRWYEAHQANVKWLEEVQQRKRVLDGSPLTPQTQTYSTTAGTTRKFSTDALEHF